MNKLPIQRDEGFTLVELLIAIVIMGVAVSTFVVALGSLTVATQNHRGHSVNETVARDFAEAIQAKASYSTTLAAAVTSTSSNTICLADDPSNFGSAVVGLYLVLDSETVKVLSGTGSVTCPATSFNLKVARGVGSIASTHVITSRVRELTACPDATTASGGNNPSWVGYLNPDGYSPPNAGVTATITGVSYLNPTASPPAYNWTQAQCWNYFTQHCRDTSSSVGTGSDTFDLLPECDPGLEMVTLSIADMNTSDGATGTLNCANPSSGWLCTSTKVLVRRGGH